MLKEEQKLCNSKMNRGYKGKEEIQIKNGKKDVHA